MMKKIFLIVFLCAGIFLCGCSRKEYIVRERARGNDNANVESVQRISDMGVVKEVSVLCKDEIVLAGMKLSDSKKRQEICDGALAIIKEQFPDAEVYIVGADEEWADDVIELNLYAEAGMDKDILEKRFKYLAKMKTENLY